MPCHAADLPLTQRSTDRDLCQQAIADVAVEATAFPHRACQVVIQIKAIWSNTTEAAANVEWVRAVHESIAANLSGAYVNYMDPELSHWEAAYYSLNYPRLQRAKAAVDPTNFFHFRQSIRLPPTPLGIDAVAGGLQGLAPKLEPVEGAHRQWRG